MEDKQKVCVEEKMDENRDSHDGKRMGSLRNTMNKMMKAFLTHLKLLGTISNASPAVLKHMHDEMKTQLETNIKNELEVMYEEENIVGLLNGLDKMAETSMQSAETRWRPSGNVEADTRTHAAMLKNEQLQVLEKTLSNLEAQNKLLQEKEQKREKRSIHTKDKILKLIADTEQITESEKLSLEQIITNIQTIG